MKFLQELNESRMYRKLGQLQGRSIHYIAEQLFEHLLALQILANKNRSLASRYAKQIMKQTQFDGFRNSQPDLYNLITLVLRQDQYSHVLETDKSIGLPELRLRRNLRELAQGNFDNNDFSYMMLMLQRRFENLPGLLIQLRRQISDWKNLSPGDQTTVIRRMLNQMRTKGIQSDFYFHLSKIID